MEKQDEKKDEQKNKKVPLVPPPVIVKTDIAPEYKMFINKKETTNK